MPRGPEIYSAVNVTNISGFMDPKFRKPLVILFVSSTDSVEFARLSWALSRSAVVGLDAEWKPTRVQQSTFPTVSLLQIACRLAIPLDGESTEDLLVFLIDLLALPLPSIWELLSDLFVSPAVLKLGFRFKQDLKYLSSTFSSQGCDPGFDRVEPFLDITSIYSYLQPKQLGRRTKETKSLATICAEVLGISLSKELQCSDWSCRPLTKEQKIYAAADAHCLLEIFAVFQLKVGREDNCSHNVAELQSRNLHCGLKEILEAEAVSCCRVIRNFFPEASSIIRATAFSDFPKRVHIEDGVFSTTSCRYSIPMHESLFKIVRNYGEKIILKETDKKPKTSKRKGKRQSSTGAICREKRGGSSDDWQGLPPWDLSLGGDGCPKFLCDVMVEGLAKHLRCVGIDAAVPLSKKPESRELIEQAHKEKRVLLTRDAKLLRHDYLLKNQIYKVRSLLKNEQLLEVIETFQLKICEDQLMSRCTKCNGRFIQKPLTTEEAIEASKGFQVIPNCLFNKNIEFWQCMDCNQLYWEGTQYHNAVQKFIDVCKLN